MDKSGNHGRATAMPAHGVDVLALFLELVDELRPPTPYLVTEHVAQLALVTDFDLLDRCLRTLIANAIEHSRHRAEIRIELGTAPGCSFFLRDNGKGLDALRAIAITDPRGKGSLGRLARALQQRGGRLRARGEPGWGATFFVTLPPA